MTKTIKEVLEAELRDRLIELDGELWDYQLDKLVPFIQQEIAKARAKDAVRLSKLNRIVKRYNVLGYVTAYNEAIKRDWQDIRLPVVRDLTLYEPAEISQTLKESKEK